MIGLITNNLDATRKACEGHDVNALWVFGSAVTSKWVEGKSDVDFLVELGERELSLFDQFLGFIVRLEDIFGIRVDVVDVDSITKPHFRDEAERTTVLLYERSCQTVPA